jgi:hypothetical protein
MTDPSGSGLLKGGEGPGSDGTPFGDGKRGRGGKRAKLVSEASKEDGEDGA